MTSLRAVRRNMARNEMTRRPRRQAYIHIKSQAWGSSKPVKIKDRIIQPEGRIFILHCRKGWRSQAK